MKSVKIIKLAGVTIFSIFLTTGCSSKPDIPKWYMKKEMSYIIGVGSARPNESNDLNFQKSEAMLNAREDLAKNMKIAIIAKDTKDIGKSKDNKIENNTEFRVESLTKVGLKNTTMLNSEFMDDGTLFIRLGIRKEILKSK